MSNIPEKSEKAIKSAVIEALGRAVAKGQLAAEPIPDFKIEIPADRKKGDYATNAAMVSAKAFHMAPVKIAEIIKENLDLSDTYASSANWPGPGFINFRLLPPFIPTY